MSISATLQTELEEAIADVVAGIYACSLIPDDHKERYIEFIEKKGITPEFIDELQKLFDAEIAGIEDEISEKTSLLSALDEIVEQEESAIAKPQAEILTGFQNYLDRRGQEVQKKLDQFDREFESAVEEIKAQSESSEQAAIRAKLGLKPETDQ